MIAALLLCRYPCTVAFRGPGTRQDLALSPEVRDFVTRYFKSIEDLEVFLLLHRTESRYWSPSEIAADLGIASHTAEQALEGLATCNFLDVRIASELLYRFSPGTASLREQAEGLIVAYGRQRIAITNLVAGLAPDPIREFADAFRLKKGT